MTCTHCGETMRLTAGWVPSYADPDNASLAPEAEPFCPKCEAEKTEPVTNPTCTCGSPLIRRESGVLICEHTAKKYEAKYGVPLK